MFFLLFPHCPDQIIQHFLFRSFEGRHAAIEPGYKSIERFFDIYPWLNTTERINMTLCTLYQSCSEITKYEHINTTCDQCTLIYNHCPWVPIKKQSSGANNFTVDKEFHMLTLFIWFMLRVISANVFIWITNEAITFQVSLYHN